VDSADSSFAALRMHDLRASLVEGSTAREGALRSALARSGVRDGVAGAAERLVVSTQVDACAGGRTIIVPGRIVGTAPSAEVDALDVRAGRPAAGGADFGAEAAFAVVFAPLRTAQTLAGAPGRVNALVVPCGPARTWRPCGPTGAGASAALPGTGLTFTGRDEEPAHRLIYKDAEGDQKMLDIFAFLLLGAAVFAAFNLISRTVEAQRREIGTSRRCSTSKSVRTTSSTPREPAHGHELAAELDHAD
jgi:putative ABC transport system permease protein